MEIFVDLRETKERNGIPGGGVKLETGAYKVKIVLAEGYEKDGSVNSIKFECRVVGGDFDGSTPWVFIGTDFEKEGNRSSLKTALISAGKTVAELNSKPVSLDLAWFKDREAFIYVKAGDPNAAKEQDKRDRNSFITPDAYARFLGETAASNTTNPAVVAQTSVASGGAARPAGASNLRSMLGK